MRELGRLPLPCDKWGECTADEVGSSKEPKTTVQLWGDGQVCELLPRSDEKNRLEANQLADKQEKEALSRDRLRLRENYHQWKLGDE